MAPRDYCSSCEVIVEPGLWQELELLFDDSEDLDSLFSDSDNFDSLFKDEEWYKV